MWRTTVFAILYIGLVFSPDVKGSCLEYGHSCWGAHGKRSSGQVVGGNKVQRESGSRNLRNNQLNVLGEDNANRIVANKFDFDEALTSAETSSHRVFSAEDFSADSNDSTKTRNYMGQRRLKFSTHLGQSESNHLPIDNNNRASNTDDSREEHQQQLQTRQLQQQRKYPRHIERWRKLPIFGFGHTFGNSQLALTDAAPLELPTRNAENELIQQFGQLAGGGRVDDAGVYYDFQ
ncbi:neuropeptide CCHamide-1 [Anastrepha obliqua]|uniref:neuropeptide CCHamide-1 n=1 Tax=Anastrepha obliqua TaxID=95512 RepID=UPI002409BF50|nr:neuropeptide CCHamide-1 [Anastrepha obliqua]